MGVLEIAELVVHHKVQVLLKPWGYWHMEVHVCEILGHSSIAWLNNCHDARCLHLEMRTEETTIQWTGADDWMKLPILFGNQKDLGVEAQGVWTAYSLDSMLHQKGINLLLQCCLH